MQQGRWVSYIYRYHGSIKCENVGFIKVQRIMHRGFCEARVQIGMKLFKQRECKYKAYLLYNGKYMRFLTELCVKAGERDTIIKHVETPWDTPLNLSISFASYDGMLFVCDDGDLLAGLWHDFALRPDELIAIDGAGEEKTVLAEDTTVQEAGKTVLAEDTGLAEDNCGDGYSESLSDKSCDFDREKVDACIQMMNTYPGLPLLADSQFLECVKIAPQDIGRLSISNWRLGTNSFLSHGYYHYQYLMFGRVQFEGEERYVIGVPGVFTSREKYLANMFGFDAFIPARKTNILTGNFGYWVSEVVRE